MPKAKATAKATFAAGCFWGVEAEFRKLEGVLATRVGYTGGQTDDPTYEEVCTGRTGHAEAVEVEFDPGSVPYERLLALFWSIHDPTQLDRQGPDVGTQYRSAILVHNEQQRAEATDSRERLIAAGGAPIVTEIVDAAPFRAAEDYHQQYLAKRGEKACASSLRRP